MSKTIAELVELVNQYEATTSDQWWAKRSEEAFKRNDHIPHSWEFEYDDGADGLMPEGWYIVGMGANGFPVDWPIRQEYGPYETKEEAEGDQVKIAAALEKTRYYSPAARQT